MKFKNLLLLLLLLTTSVLAGQDYYKLLGLKRDATDDQIKKAFKKLAIRYHPDKNQDNPEAAKKKFQEIANAYETLSDPEKRRIYDQLGEEGVKRQQAGGGGGPGGGGAGGFEDMFNGFFSGMNGGGQQFGGGGPKMEFNFGGQGGQFNGFEDILKGFGFGGGGMGQQQQKQQRPKDLFPPSPDASYIRLTDRKEQHLFKRRADSDIWVVVFFRSLPDKQAELIKTLASKNKGVFKVGIADCTQASGFCADYGIQKEQKLIVKLFDSRSDDKGDFMTDTLASQDWRSLASQAARSYPSALIQQIDSVFDYQTKFLSGEHQQIRVILITERKTTSPVFKALASSYKDKLIFGEVHASTSKQLVEELLAKYGLEDKTYPILFVVKSDQMNANAVTRYTNAELDFESVSNFLKLFAKNPSFRGSKREVSQRGGKINILTETTHTKDKLCHREQPENLCVLVPQGISQEILEHFKNEPIVFAQLPSEVTISNVPTEQITIIRPKRSKYRVYEQQQNTKQSLIEFIEEVISGSGDLSKWQSMKGGNVLKFIHNKSADL